MGRLTRTCSHTRAHWHQHASHPWAGTAGSLWHGRGGKSQEGTSGAEGEEGEHFGGRGGQVRRWEWLRGVGGDALRAAGGPWPLRKGTLASPALICDPHCVQGPGRVCLSQPRVRLFGEEWEVESYCISLEARPILSGCGGGCPDMALASRPALAALYPEPLTDTPWGWGGKGRPKAVLGVCDVRGGSLCSER